MTYSPEMRNQSLVRELALLGSEDRLVAHAASAKLEEHFLRGNFPEKDVAQIFIELCAAATPFRKTPVTTCPCGDGEIKVSPLSGRTAITALGCLRNLLKKTRRQELLGDDEDTDSGIFPGWRMQALFWSSLKANDFESHLKILTQNLAKSSCIISYSSGRQSCPCTTTFCGHSVLYGDVSKENVLSPSLIELILAGTLRLLSSAIKLETETLSSNSEKGDGQGVLEMICGLVERTWEFLLDATAEPHFHAAKEQCLFGYIQHKLMTVVLHLAPYFPERPAMACGCIRVIGRHLQRYFALCPPSLDSNLCSSDLHSSPFYSSWLASATSLDPTSKSSQESNLPNNVKIRAFLVLLKAVGTRPLVASPSADNRLQTEALSSLISSLQLMLGLWQPEILQKDRPNHVGTVLHHTAEVKEFDDGDSNLLVSEPLYGECVSENLLQLLQDEDDVMLDILLELFQIVPNFPTLCRPPSWFSQEMALSLVDTLHPLRLFHGFLSMIAYDHLVLVDYLISADTGSRFLAYVLQCLSLAVNSWPSILHFANPVTINQSKSSLSPPAPSERRSPCIASVSPLSCTESLSFSRIQDQNYAPISDGATVCSAGGYPEDCRSKCGTSFMVKMEGNSTDVNIAKPEEIETPRDNVIYMKGDAAKQRNDGEKGKKAALRKRGSPSEEHTVGRFEDAQSKEFVKSMQEEVPSEVGCSQTGGSVGFDLCKFYKNDEEHWRAVDVQGHLPGRMSRVKSSEKSKELYKFRKPSLMVEVESDIELDQKTDHNNVGLEGAPRKIPRRHGGDSEGLKQESSSMVGKEGGRIPRTSLVVKGKMVVDCNCTLSREGEKSMECLQVLRKTLERVHRGGLFPYNPTALVRRLLALESLWIEWRGVYEL